jgi:hypothetical protein
VGGEKLELAIDERHLLGVAGCPRAALLEAEIPAAHRSDALCRGHHPECAKARCPRVEVLENNLG